MQRKFISTPALPHDTLKNIKRTIAITKQHLEGNAEDTLELTLISLMLHMKDDIGTANLPLFKEIANAYRSGTATKEDIEKFIEVLEAMAEVFN